MARRSSSDRNGSGLAHARELALLEAADEDGLEAARADLLGPRHLHLVGLRALPHAHPELLHDAHDLGNVDRPRAEHSAQLGQGALRPR